MLPPRKLHPDTLRYDCKENSGVGHPSEFCALKKRTAKYAKMGTPVRLMHVAFVSPQSSASAQSISNTHQTFIQAHGETLGFEVLCHWFAPQMSCIQGKTTNFIQFSIACNANESRG